MASVFGKSPTPKTHLGRYRQLAPRASIHVSPISLGGMSLGDTWAGMMGQMSKESSFALLDAYFDAGGNFIDTASNYQEGSSEKIIGQWSEQRGLRDQLIISTKYTNYFKGLDQSVTQKVNFVGNNIKNLKLSVENSLENLRTTYIDILYLHYWDLHTSFEEIMDGLHNLIVSGKVLYLGISDAPAWFVVKANEYARQHGKTPFVVYQAPYSCVQRDIEREILPMCRHEGIGLTVFNVLASGHIRSDEEEEKRKKSGENGRTAMGPWLRTPDEKKMCDTLEIIAKQVGTKSITAVAIAYVMHKAPYIFPIVGGRKIEHLLANIEGLKIRLTPEQMKQIDDTLPFDKGFPSNIIGEYGVGLYPFLILPSATFDVQPPLPPILAVSD
ncbi:aryl-alcohol dehydrogenase [Phlebopus sp. FC_14]|nr:aryl-alcohol dehydrogenase [Phlebopus sp. FC_14]